jgi:hypothetical protein
MPHALNLTLNIKQDAETLKTLQALKADFATKIQPAMDKALRDSKIVHFARVVVIDDKYLQVITEYDGDHKEYTEFFRVALPDVFKALFALAEGAPPWQDLDQQSFFEVSKGTQKRSLGNSADGMTDASGLVEGYLFSAYGSRTVKEILPKLS